MDPVLVVLTVGLVLSSLTAVVAMKQRNWALSRPIAYSEPKPPSPTACEYCGDIAGREHKGRSFGRAIRERWDELRRERDAASVEKRRWRQRAATSQLDGETFRRERDAAYAKLNSLDSERSAPLSSLIKVAPVPGGMKWTANGWAPI